MDREASNIAPGANGLILMPYLSGMNYPYADEKATGIFFGVNLCHSRAHFVRAILEAVSFLLCQSVDEIRAYGIDVKKIYSLGGGASSELWCKIKADMTGCEIVVPKRDEVTCLGAAILAAVGAGLYSTLEEAVMASSDRQTLYVPQYQKEYSDICNSYKKKADVSASRQVLLLPGAPSAPISCCAAIPPAFPVFSPNYEAVLLSVHNIQNIPACYNGRFVR